MAVDATAQPQIEPGSNMLPLRGEFLSSQEQIHGMVFNGDLERGGAVAVTSSGASCAGEFSATAEGAGTVTIACSDGRLGEGSYVIESAGSPGSLDALSGYGCLRLQKSGINDSWTARVVFGALAFAPGYPRGLDCRG